MGIGGGSGEECGYGVLDWRATAGCHVLKPWGPLLRGDFWGRLQTSVHMSGEGQGSTHITWRSIGKAGDRPSVMSCLLAQSSGLTNSRIIELPSAEGERILPFPLTHTSYWVSSMSPASQEKAGELRADYIWFQQVGNFDISCTLDLWTYFFSH